MKLSLTTVALLSALSAHAMNDHHARLFKDPLILGASVSAGYGTRDGGPSSVIAKILNPQAKIDNRARSGHSSLESTRALDLTTLKPSIVLALDLFFWDAARDTYGPEFEKNTTRLFTPLFDRKIPLIVGKIPVGVDFPQGIREAGKRKSAARINTFLERLCTQEKNCVLYDPAECFKEMKSARYFSDALHTTDEGNLFCANVFLKSGLLDRFKIH